VGLPCLALSAAAVAACGCLRGAEHAAGWCCGDEAPAACAGGDQSSPSWQSASAVMARTYWKMCWSCWHTSLTAWRYAMDVVDLLLHGGLQAKFYFTLCFQSLSTYVWRYPAHTHANAVSMAAVALKCKCHGMHCCLHLQCRCFFRADAANVELMASAACCADGLWCRLLGEHPHPTGQLHQQGSDIFLNSTNPDYRAVLCTRWCSAHSQVSRAALGPVMTARYGSLLPDLKCTNACQRVAFHCMFGARQGALCDFCSTCS